MSIRQAPSPKTQSIYLASICYGGMAHADCLTSLLGLKDACAEAGVSLRIELSGGEALFSRGMAAQMAKFLASDCSHLIFADGRQGFPFIAPLELVASGDDVARNQAAGLFMIPRASAQAMHDEYPQTHARLGDLSGAAAQTAAMVFDNVIDPQTKRYLDEIDSFLWRWRLLS